MTDSDVELLPCPFCGAEARPKYDYFTGCSMKHHFVVCTKDPNHRGGVGCYNAAPGRGQPSDNVGSCDKCQRDQAPCEISIAAWSARPAALAATPMAKMREENERLRECKIISEGSRLDHITSALLNIIAGIEDEGDRVYFRSTNDADALREIAHELDLARWAALTGEAP